MPLSRQKDYLVWSIFSLVCCFCPIGIAALIFSIKTRDATNQNNEEKAAQNSRTAFYLNIAALVVGIIMIIVIIVLFVVARSHT